MNRRGFFATLAALCAAPAALLRLPKAKASSKGFTGSVGVLNTFKVEELAANPMHTVEVDDQSPHECEWQDVPSRSAQRCTVCGDVRSKMRAREVDEFAARRRWVYTADDVERHLATHKRFLANKRIMRAHWLF